MILQCPSCKARVRIRQNRLAGRKLKFKCPSCGTPAVADVPGKDHQAPSSSRVRVLVAHSDPAVCQTIGAVVAAEGLECRQCHDGDSALAQMHSWKPQVAMVDVALPGLYAFEVVEKVQSLSVQDRPGIILISSVYNRTAYKRKPADLYGADDYIELHHIPDDLVPKIRALLDGRQPPAVRPPKSEQERAQWASVNAELKKAGERQIEGGDVRDRARQLARIIASDIALYHHDKLSLARAGEALETCFAAEIEEAVRLFLDRFPGHEDLARQLVTETLQDLVQGHLHPS